MSNTISHVMEELKGEIEAKIAEVAPRITKFRREIHRNPELSGLEKKTSSFVAGVLDDNDIDLRREVGGYGVVGDLAGGSVGPEPMTFAIRADMDALPIQEKSEEEYASCVPGVMHACGHDAHTAILMGTAVVLSSVREKLPGNLKFIFQPSEERSATGAKKMIAAGALDPPMPDAIVALHCFPELEAGKIAHRAGYMTAAADRVRIKIIGRSGHASRPHQTVDAVLVASLVINALHHIVSRRTDPLHNAVISIGTIKGGHAPNIIADEVELDGTVRTLEKEAREQIPGFIEDAVRGVTGSMDASYEFDYRFGTPPVINDPKIDELIRGTGVELLGVENVERMADPLMGAEDFAYFAERVPGALFRIGTCNPEKGITAPLHNSSFDLDEEVLAIGVRLLCNMALKFLSGAKHG